MQCSKTINATTNNNNEEEDMICNNRYDDNDDCFCPIWLELYMIGYDFMWN